MLRLRWGRILQRRPLRECFDKATDKDYMQSLCPKFLKMEDINEISLWCM
jgi:hypothetical protein